MCSIGSPVGQAHAARRAVEIAAAVVAKRRFEASGSSMPLPPAMASAHVAGIQPVRMTWVEIAPFLPPVIVVVGIAVVSTMTSSVAIEALDPGSATASVAIGDVPILPVAVRIAIDEVARTVTIGSDVIASRSIEIVEAFDEALGDGAPARDRADESDAGDRGTEYERHDVLSPHSPPDRFARQR